MNVPLLFKVLRIFVVLLIVFIVSPPLRTAQAEEVVRIGGAGSGLGVMKKLAAVFEKTHPGIQIKVLPNLGSSGGVKALLHGALDVAIIGRPLKTEERKSGAVATDCATTPFVFVVHKNVTKTDISSRELEMIYNGQTQKWPDGTRIRLVLRPTGDTDSIIVKNISKNMEQAVLAASARPDMLMAVTDQEAADYVAKIPGAFSGATLSQVETEDIAVKILSFNGITPTLANLAKGSYPLVKSLTLVSTLKTKASAVEFIQFTRSAQGRAILTKSGCLPLDGNRGGK